MIRCLAIDDEPLALRQLASYINKVPFLELAAQCQSALKARSFLEHDSVDAIFCDINMPDLDGMEFVKSLAAPPLVVFTTAYSEYAVEGFRVNAVDYLLKPFGFQEFLRAANRLKIRLDNDNSELSSPLAFGKDAWGDAIFLKTGQRIVKVSMPDIRYIEGMSEYLKVWVDDNPKPIITLMSMAKMAENLPRYFMRIHRSYIINLTKIQEVNKNLVIMDAHTQLPIGDNYKEAFQKFLERKFLGK
ncbi:MAG: response regulator transcription factor [Bacteroidaceae bacterium]|jgi:DNA-binding LytR/AlgR family response regulator|nr:response regulator transcription factor [Bacteroidaceae bacterium]